MAALFLANMSSKRSIIYVDGFNLYYGALKGTPYKWLDLQVLFERLRQDDDIQVVRYFTARVGGRNQVKQLTYLRALATCEKVEVILGKFKQHRVQCQIRACKYCGNRWFSVPEEKRTDVNIGVRLLDDAYQDEADRFVIVSGDSDLVPAVNMLKTRFPEKEVIVYVPSRTEIRGAAVELRNAADKDRTFPLALIRVSQFPAEVSDGQGGTIARPPDW